MAFNANSFIIFILFLLANTHAYNDLSILWATQATIVKNIKACLTAIITDQAFLSRFIKNLTFLTNISQYLIASTDKLSCVQNASIIHEGGALLITSA